MHQSTSTERVNSTVVRSPSFKQLLQLAIPIAIGMASLSVLGLIETIILGHYHQDALAASAAANYTFFIYLSAFAGFAIAVQSQVARYTDQHPKKAQKAVYAGLIQLGFIASLFIAISYFFGQSVLSAQLDNPKLTKLATDFLITKSFCLIAIAVLMGLRGFWHGSNQPKLFLLCLVLSHLLTGVLCYALVFGQWGFPELGLQGSALATVFSMYLGAGILLIASIKPLKLKELLKETNSIELKSLWHLAWPTSLQQVVFAFGTAVFMAVIARTSTTDLAAAHILISLSLVLILPIIGFGMAATTFISDSFAQFQQSIISANTVNQWYRITCTLSLSIMLLFGIIMITATEQVLSLLSEDQEVLTAAYWPLIILAPSLLFEAFTISTKQSLYAIHQNTSVLKVLFITQWLLLLPAMLFLHHNNYGSLEAYTLLHAGQRIINSVWLWRIWQRTHKAQLN